jgi:hypothetical protein
MTQLTGYQGNGPWNVDVQVVDASDSKTITFTKISTKKKTLQIPLPKRVDKDGGVFTVDLGNVSFHERKSSSDVQDSERRGFNWV